MRTKVIYMDVITTIVKAKIDKKRREMIFFSKMFGV